MILYPTFLEEWNSYQSCSKWTIRLYLNCNGTLKDTHLAKLIGCEKKLAQTLPAGFHLHLCFSFIWKMSCYNSFMTYEVKSDWRWNLNATFQIWSNGRGRLFEIHYSLENRLITNSCSSFFRVLLLWWKSVLIQRQKKVLPQMMLASRRWAHSQLEPWQVLYHLIYLLISLSTCSWGIRIE